MLELRFLIAVSLSACLPLSAGITFQATLHPEACTEVHVPGWKDPGNFPEPYYWLSEEKCDLDFSGVDGGVVVKTFCLPLNEKQGRFYSPSIYAVDLPSGRVRKATETEWEHADPYLTFRDRRLGNALPKDRPLTYQGKEFAKTGAKWPVGYARTISQDGSFLSVNSWDGSNWESEINWNRDVNGHYYVDIYNVASGQRLLALQGEFHDVDPWEMLDSGAWISKYYYVLQLDRHKLKRFVICDVRRAGAADGK